MKYTNNFQLPQHMVEAIVQNTYDLAQNDPTTISITTMINPPRIRQLTLRHWADLEEDASSGMWRLLGSAVHEVMQRIDTKNRLIEERLREKIMGITVAGRPDLYEEPFINDYKITSVWAVKFEKSEWVDQINCYAWFIRKLGFPVEQGFINAILRDWRSSEAKKYKGGYPPIPFKVIPVEIWKFGKQDDYVHDRIALHLNSETDTDEELPLCTDKERWSKDIRCTGYCAVNKFCSYWQKKYGKKHKKVFLKLNV